MNAWDGISEFIAVSERQSFTAAAKQLGISVAQVSRQVTALEEKLGTQLFYRTTRKVSVTEAGQIYYQHCRQLLDGLGEAERAIGNLTEVPRGKLKLTAPTTYGETVIAPLVNDFVARYPDLEVQCRFTNQKLDLVLEGYDMAIRLGRLEGTTGSLMTQQLSTRRLYACAARSYIAKRGEPYSLSELNHHNCLVGTLDYWRFEEDGRERTIRIHGSIHANSGQALLDAALKGIGIVQLPDYYVDPWIASGDLIPVLTKYQPSDEGIWAIYPTNRHLSPKIRMLVEHLGRYLGS
ncbi:MULTISPECIES: LysR substrate-binding domain-containing protein [Thalassospira]|uniref:LysR family transcriptional regulator n=2 Tax=Thalassospira TaxID=168934 RepID=A0A367WEW7_9PROT|nr:MULTISPECIES: LysR substrate-binding domain-containing protein [Thalassospira]MDG4717400.1 LysR substrate-binding domain-containing protein [Thalassospira sp. FZY0004]RCK39121.1 LysR family transcriptional regulator [Thalassospira profundimaris]